jgi:hypothetical protein
VDFRFDRYYFDIIDWQQNESMLWSSQSLRRI